jgi:cytochrome c biogenesis protein CcmG/thiol:disulfide interchange protein DsbE
MNRHLSVSLLGGALILAALVVPMLTRERQRTAPASIADTVATGKLASDFELTDIQGRTVSLASLRGKVVFLNFWATWCGPCRTEMPSMEKLYNAFANRKDFVMLAISQDAKGAAVVQPYVRKHGYHFEVLLDPQSKVAESYDVTGVPETFIIDRDGRIVAHHLGAVDWASEDVRDALRELLDAKAG